MSEFVSKSISIFDWLINLFFFCYREKRFNRHYKVNVYFNVTRKMNTSLFFKTYSHWIFIVNGQINILRNDFGGKNNNNNQNEQVYYIDIVLSDTLNILNFNLSKTIINVIIVIITVWRAYILYMHNIIINNIVGRKKLENFSLFGN